MNYRDLFRAIFFILLIGLFIFQPGSGFASDILIFSTSHSEQSKEKERVGVLVLGISTFSDITEVMVNETRVEVPKTTKIEVKVPYELHEGKNRFLISVKTEDDQLIKEFILIHGDDDDDKKKYLSFIGIVSLKAATNEQKVSDDQDKTMGVKLGGIFIPGFSIYLFDGSSIRFRSIFTNEKYFIPLSKNEREPLESSEIQFTQLSAAWIQSIVDLIDLEVGFGWNDIGGENKYGFYHETHMENDVFFYFDVKLNFGPDYSIGSKIDFKDKSTHPESEDSAYDTDAWVYGTRLSFSGKFTKWISLALKFRIERTDADGKYKDQNVMKLDINPKISIFDLSILPTVGFKYTLPDEKDPLLNEKPEKKKLTTGIKLMYSITKWTIPMLEYKFEYQDSPVDSMKYQNHNFGFSILLLY